MKCPTPTKDFVFVEPVYETQTEGGIVLCKQAAERHLPNVGFVRAIAPGLNVDFQIGDKILHNRFVQDWEIIPWGDKKLTRIKASEVHAIL